MGLTELTEYRCTLDGITETVFDAAEIWQAAGKPLKSFERWVSEVFYSGPEFSEDIDFTEINKNKSYPERKLLVNYETADSLCIDPRHLGNIPSDKIKHFELRIHRAGPKPKPKLKS